MAAVAAGWLIFGLSQPSAAADLPNCESPAAQTKAQGGGVTVAARKSWQPRGGEFKFAVQSPNPVPNDALITVCFRWQQQDQQGATPQAFKESRPTRVIDLQPDKKTMTIGATVPDLPSAPPWCDGGPGKPAGVYTGLWTVPVADARILIYQPDGKIFLDVSTPVGVTRVSWGVGLAILAILLMLLALWGVCRRCEPGVKEASPLLQIIATEKNYASLSQAQIMLWTLVVGASAIYVMTLSGSLIDISSGTLVLLGISGAATLGSKLKSNKDDASGNTGAANPAAASPAAPNPATPPPTPPAAPKPPMPAHPKPLWSDLVINLEVVGDKWISTIDVTRVQMLFFTLVTAGFVLMTVAASYEIPQIPEGFLILMGISNGVYVGSKFTK